MDEDFEVESVAFVTSVVDASPVLMDKEQTSGLFKVEGALVLADRTGMFVNASEGELIAAMIKLTAALLQRATFILHFVSFQYSKHSIDPCCRFYYSNDVIELHGENNSIRSRLDKAETFCCPSLMMMMMMIW